MSTTQQEQTRAAAPQEYLLEMRGITKAFAGVQALKGVDFYVRPGTVVAYRKWLLDFFTKQWKAENREPCIFESQHYDRLQRFR
ncbi:hypothetical protein [Gemmiger formicilis]|uniref:hypothetical protein n=1 Tax=Gemmiger formicilis TaxID=745368 RepID=UPI0022E95737|nr:hypothetical protein [Gemmiger formicilis]